MFVRDGSEGTIQEMYHSEEAEAEDVVGDAGQHLWEHKDAKSGG